MRMKLKMARTKSMLIFIGFLTLVRVMHTACTSRISSNVLHLEAGMTMDWKASEDAGAPRLLTESSQCIA